ncbi:MAG: enoyl-CoA hydratase [Candidatus Hydrogenedentota bacterium]
MSGSIIIKYEPNGVCQLRLYRPEKRNALNLALMESLCFALEDVEKDSDVRAIVLAGEGPVFCAGLDLKESEDADTRESATGLVARLLMAVTTSSKVTIASVHGAALAGGAGLMSACDLVVAEEDAIIGYPEVRRGLPAALVLCLLRRQVADRHARELLLLGEAVSARRAFEMGLVSKVTSKGEAMSECIRIAGTVCKGAPGAIAASKRLLSGLWSRSLEEDLAAAMDEHKALRDNPEAREGLAAFHEKRSPVWDRTAQ